jgi:hypothetical protein
MWLLCKRGNTATSTSLSLSLSLSHTHTHTHTHTQTAARYRIWILALFYTPMYEYMFIHNLLNVLLQIANKMGFKKKQKGSCFPCTIRCCTSACMVLKKHHKRLVVRCSVVGCGTVIQAGRLLVRFSMSLNFFSLPNASSSTIALGSTQLLTAMSTTKYFWGVERCRRVRLTLPVTGIALLYVLYILVYTAVLLIWRFSRNILGYCTIAFSLTESRTVNCVLCNSIQVPN